MNEIKETESYLLSTLNIFKIKDDEWNILREQKDSFFYSNNPKVDYLRWPGFIFSSEEAKDFYLKIYNKFKNNKIYTPSRGNLSESNRHILLGIRPSHAMPNQMDLSGFPAWLLGDSSAILQKLLTECNVFPYLGNVYNQPSQPFNKDFSWILAELLTIFYIYKTLYNVNNINVVFMGNYDEYPLLVSTLKNNKIFKSIGIDINTYSIWHPSYLLRSWSTEKFNHWKKQFIEKFKEI